MSGTDETVQFTIDAVNDASPVLQEVNSDLEEVVATAQSSSNAMAGIGSGIGQAEGDVNGLTGAVNMNTGATASNMGMLRSLTSTLGMVSSDVLYYEMVHTRLEAAQKGVEVAQLAVNKAIEQYGADSPKAQIATEQLQIAQDRLAMYEQKSSFEMIHFATQIPMLASNIMTLVGGVGSLAGGLGGMSGIMDAVAGSTGVLDASFLGMDIALGPIIVVILAIAAAIALLYLAWTNDWGGIREIVGNAVIAIQNTLNGLVAAIQNTLGGAMDWLKSNWQDLLVGVLTGPVGLAVMAWKNNWGGFQTTITQGVSSLQSNLTTAFQQLGEAIGGATGVFTKPLDQIAAQIKEKFPAISEAIQGGTDILKGNWIQGLQKLVDATPGVFNELSSVVTPAINQLGQMFQAGFSSLAAGTVEKLQALAAAFQTFGNTLAGLESQIAAGWEKLMDVFSGKSADFTQTTAAITSMDAATNSLAASFAKMPAEQFSEELMNLRERLGDTAPMFEQNATGARELIAAFQSGQITANEFNMYTEHLGSTLQVVNGQITDTSSSIQTASSSMTNAKTSMTSMDAAANSLAASLAKIDPEKFSEDLMAMRERLGDTAPMFEQNATGARELINAFQSGSITADEFNMYMEHFGSTLQVVNGQIIDTGTTFQNVSSQLTQSTASVSSMDAATKSLATSLSHMNADNFDEELMGINERLGDSIIDLTSNATAAQSLIAAYNSGAINADLFNTYMERFGSTLRVVNGQMTDTAAAVQTVPAAFNAAQTAVPPALDNITNHVNSFSSNTKDTFTKFYDWLVGHSLWQDLWTAMNTITQQGGTILSTTIETVFNLMSKAADLGVSLLKKTIQTGFQLVFSTAKQIVESSIGLMTTMINGLIQTIQQTTTSWDTLVNDIISSTPRLKSAIEDFWNWASPFWSERITEIATVTDTCFKQINSQFTDTTATMRAVWNDTLNTMVTITRNSFEEMVREISAEVDAIIARLRAAQHEVSGGSIWPDMLDAMLKQTNQGMTDIENSFAQGLSGTRGVIPQIQAVKPVASSYLNGIMGGGRTMQTITVPTNIYLDGQLISKRVESHLVDTVMANANRARRI